MFLAILPWLTEIGILFGLTAAGVGVYKAGDGVGKNIVPIALIGAGTFLALAVLKKSGKA